MTHTIRNAVAVSFSSYFTGLKTALKSSFHLFDDVSRPVWHPSLTKHYCQKTLSVYKTAVKNCCFQSFYILSHYVSKSGLERLDDRRDMITKSLFRQLKDPKPPLSSNELNELKAKAVAS